MSRLLFFPPPYPDEDFRSLVFRYHVRSVNTEILQTKIELFNIKSYKQPLFPRNLQTLLDRMPIGHKFSLNQIIYDYTWFGLYQAFFTNERKEEVLQNLQHGSGKSGNIKGLTLGASSIITPNMKYCPQCAQSDEQQYGEVYLHRLHQASFLKVCPIHMTRLMDRCHVCGIPYGSNENGQLLRGLECSNGHALHSHVEDSNSNQIQSQMDLIEEIIYIRENCNKITFDEIRDMIIKLLSVNGFLTEKRELNQAKLIFHLKESINKESNLLFDLTNYNQHYFIYSLLSKNSMVIFIGYIILLIKSLGYSCRSLFNCTAVLIDQIGDGIKVKDNKKKDKFKRINIMPETVEKKREKLNELLKCNEFKNLSDLHGKHVYRWLFANDKEWLENNLPSRFKKARLDLHLIDIKLVTLIRNAAREIPLDYHLPIKRGTILNQLPDSDRNQFRHYREELPLSNNEIDKYVETTKQFLIRSIPRHYLKLQKKGVSTMTVSQFKEMASVSYYLNGDYEVDNYIRLFLEENRVLRM